MDRLPQRLVLIHAWWSFTREGVSVHHIGQVSYIASHPRYPAIGGIIRCAITLRDSYPPACSPPQSPLSHTLSPRNKDGKPFGKHFTGPSWEATDGSRVTGKAVANAPSPDANSIPWLLVNILSHDGTGVLSRATTIQRLNTKGGKAPASGCDAAHVGQELRVPYSADYLFYTPK